MKSILALALMTNAVSAALLTSTEAKVMAAGVLPNRFQIKSATGQSWKVDQTGILRLANGTEMTMAVLDASIVYRTSSGFIALMNAMENSVIGLRNQSVLMSTGESGYVVQKMEFGVRKDNVAWQLVKIYDGTCAIRTNMNNVGRYIGYDAKFDRLVAVSSSSTLVQSWTCPPAGVKATVRDLPFQMKTATGKFQIQSMDKKSWKYDASKGLIRLNSGNEMTMGILNDTLVYKDFRGFVAVKVYSTPRFLVVANTTGTPLRTGQFVPESALSGWFFYRLKDGNCAIRTEANGIHGAKYVGYDATLDVVKAVAPTDFKVVKWTCPDASGISTTEPKDLPFFMQI